MKYLFGDTDLATRRLEALADAFDKTSARFVRLAVNAPPALAVDLGCGPGRTTHMLADASRGKHTIGLDNSEHFVDLATQSAAPGVTFDCHDITDVPLPTGLASLMYCRFLLTHMHAPAALLADWASQLHVGGLILAEEVEAVCTKNSVFAFYIDTVAAMLKARDCELYVGRIIDRFDAPAPLRRLTSEVTDVTLTRPQAARLFHMNIQTWRRTEFITLNYCGEMIDELARDIEALTHASTERVDVTWRMRQVVYERADA